MHAHTHIDELCESKFSHITLCSFIPGSCTTRTNCFRHIWGFISPQNRKKMCSSFKRESNSNEPTSQGLCMTRSTVNDTTSLQMYLRTISEGSEVGKVQENAWTPQES